MTIYSIPFTDDLYLYFIDFIKNSLPNSNVSNFDMALPGTIPMLNKRCIVASLLSALALKFKTQTLLLR